jgi:hypothetical protein
LRKEEDDVSRAAWITLVVMVAATCVLIGWDIVVAVNDERGDTISEMMLAAASKHPSLAFSWGGITGHMFWPRESPIFWRKPHTAFLLGGLAVAMLAFEFFVTLKVLPIGPLLVGIALGHWLWPQKSK